MFTFVHITVGFLILLSFFGSLTIALTVTGKILPKKLSPAEYDKKINYIEDQRAAQIETASTPGELDEINANWDAAEKQYRRSKH